MSSSRRAFLAGTVGALSTTALSRRAAADTRAPHFIVQVVLTGGHDAVMSIDPKDPARVEGKIDCGYRGDERVRGARRVFGPSIGELLPFDEQMCIVRGVRVDTVAHSDGYAALHHGRVLSSPDAPLIPLVIGQQLPGSAPIPYLDLGTRGTLPSRDADRVEPVYTGVKIFEDIRRGNVAPMRGSPSWGALRRRFHQQEAASVFAGSDAGYRDYLRALELEPAARRLLDRKPPPVEFLDLVVAPQYTFALESIRRQIAKYMVVAYTINWFDSHSDNVSVQQQRLHGAFTDLARFVRALASETNEHGRLLDQTTIVVGSELGRYPRFNSVLGKDHWPENAWILLGKGVRAGATVGHTDDTYRSLPIDFATGAPEGANRRPLYIDNLFATLARIAGANARYRDDEVLAACLA